MLYQFDKPNKQKKILPEKHFNVKQNHFTTSKRSNEYLLPLLKPFSGNITRIQQKNQKPEKINFPTEPSLNNLEMSNQIENQPNSLVYEYEYNQEQEQENEQEYLYYGSYQHQIQNIRGYSFRRQNRFPIQLNIDLYRAINYQNRNLNNNQSVEKYSTRSPLSTQIKKQLQQITPGPGEYDICVNKNIKLRRKQIK